VICPTGAYSKILSSTASKNISLHRLVETALLIPTVPPHKGRIAIVTDAGCGCGGRGSVLRVMGSQGGLAKGL
jgi:hypothetical protein